MKKAPPRPVQFFSDEYLERCRLEGVKYQTRIKRLMHDWTGGPTEP